MELIYLLVFVNVIIILSGICLLLIIKINKIKQNINMIFDLLDSENKMLLQPTIIIKEKELEKLLYHFNNVIKKQNEKIYLLESEIAAKELILTGLSHDLRTPLTSLMGYLEVLKDGIVEDSEIDEYLSIAYKKSEDLKKYTDHLFDWFKLKNNMITPNLTYFDINETTKKIVLEWFPVLSKQNIEIDIKSPNTILAVWLDIDFYTRIINNLISNAFKHSHCTCINIKIHVIGDLLNIKIMDNGIGVPQAHLIHIFDLSYKVDSSRSIESSGLGLAIVKELVELQNGTIKATNIKSSGMEFSLTFQKVIKK